MSERTIGFREVLAHMNEEYAQHYGHADFCASESTAG